VRDKTFWYVWWLTGIIRITHEPHDHHRYDELERAMRVEGVESTLRGPTRVLKE